MQELGSSAAFLYGTTTQQDNQAASPQGLPRAQESGRRRQGSAEGESAGGCQEGRAGDSGVGSSGSPPPVRARYLIVDGHSVIFSWPEIRALHQRRTVLGRDALVKLLTAYQDESGVRVVAVFDGAGGKISESSDPAGIQVFYSPSGGTADQVIERLVANYASKHDITVATSDLLEQQTAISFGALCISPDELRTLLLESRTDLARRLKQRRQTR